MATVTICSDFGAQENKICHCFHFFFFYLPQNDGTRCHDLSFLNRVLSQFVHSPLSPSLRGSLIPLHFVQTISHNFQGQVQALYFSCPFIPTTAMTLTYTTGENLYSHHSVVLEFDELRLGKDCRKYRLDGGRDAEFCLVTLSNFILFNFVSHLSL